MLYLYTKVMNNGKGQVNSLFFDIEQIEEFTYSELLDFGLLFWINSNI